MKSSKILVLKKGKSFCMVAPLFHSMWNNIVSNLPQWDNVSLLETKNEWKSGGAIRKVIPPPKKKKLPYIFNFPNLFYYTLVKKLLTWNIEQGHKELEGAAHTNWRGDQNFSWICYQS